MRVTNHLYGSSSDNWKYARRKLSAPVARPSHIITALPGEARRGDKYRDDMSDRPATSQRTVSGEGENVVNTAKSFFDKLSNPLNRFVLTTEEQGADMHARKAMQA
jgi:hypothetical protein